MSPRENFNYVTKSTKLNTPGRESFSAKRVAESLAGRSKKTPDPLPEAHRTNFETRSSGRVKYIQTSCSVCYNDSWLSASAACRLRLAFRCSTRAMLKMSDRHQMDRSSLVKTTLVDQDDRGILRDASPSERMSMVWQMTLDAWTFMDPAGAKSEFQRHAVRIERRGR